MATTPSMAAELPAASPFGSSTDTTGWGTAAWNSDSVSAEHRRYRRRHRHGVDAGDIIAGVLIIGGIAAIADAASKPRRERQEDVRYRERRTTVRSGGDDGIDNAVNMCLDTIERDVRVESVDSVNRSRDGWNVAGTLYNGEGFNCQIGSNGRISNIDYGGQVAQLDYQQVQDRQYSDAQYAAAWDREETRPYGSDPSQTAQYEDTVPSDQQPAYPGGPLPGEDGYDEAMGG
ncbi:hypothetical protein [Pontixanthobacter aquaemixtae]|nr:hypothetical protein [Pontixanthobacter aquaemixtae]